MSRQINQPITQVRLTNVAIVRMNRNGKRFEIACYRNKIVNYRQGIETDLSEVLQTDRIFTNVSKGQFAKSSDLQKSFGTTDEERICEIILQRGQVQVSDMERSAQYENIHREIATMICQKCVDPMSNRPYTVNTIRAAMKEAEFVVHPTRSVKQQFLDCVRILKDVLPMERAKMELSLVLPASSSSSEEELRQRLEHEGVSNVTFPTTTTTTTTTTTNSAERMDPLRLILLVDPSLYRTMETIAKEYHGKIDILRQVVTQEGDVNLESELERKQKHARNNAAAAEGATIENVVDNQHTDVGISGEGKYDEEILEMAEHLEQTIFNEQQQQQQQRQLEDDHDDSNHNDVVQQSLLLQTRSKPNNRNNNSPQKSKKKSKKAKRREKEEEAERLQRMEAERLRREQRAERLEQQQQPSTNEVPNNSSSSNTNDGTKKGCTTCGGLFTPAQFRAHFKSDWHRYNLQLKLKGVAPVSEEEFRVCDADAFFDRG